MSKATAHSALSALETPVCNVLYAVVLANRVIEDGLGLGDEELEENIKSYVTYHAWDMARELKKAWDDQHKEASK